MTQPAAPSPSPAPAPGGGAPNAPPPSPFQVGPSPLDAVLGRVLPHLRRWLAWDFRTIHATDDERAALRAAPRPQTDPLVQDYLAWRRSLCWVALVCAVAGCIDSVVSFFQIDTGPESPTTGFAAFLQLVWLASRAFLAYALVRAALGWTDPRGSRGRLRLGWAVALFVPLLTLQLPLADLVIKDRWGEIEREAGAEQLAQVHAVREVQQNLVRFLFAFQAFFLAMPGILSMFPGAIRAGLLMKSLLPGRSMGAVLTALLAPIYAVLIIVLMTTFQQVGSSAWFLVGTLLLCLAPLASARGAWALVPPLTPDEATQRLHLGRGLPRFLSFAGLALLLVGLFQVKFFGVALAGGSDAMLHWFRLVVMGVWFVAMLSTYTVVSADALLGGMALSDQVRAAAVASPQFAADTSRLAVLEAAVGAAAPAGAAAATPR